MKKLTTPKAILFGLGLIALSIASFPYSSNIVKPAYASIGGFEVVAYWLRPYDSAVSSSNSCIVSCLESPEKALFKLFIILFKRVNFCHISITIVLTFI